MGLIYADITLRNPRDTNLNPMTVKALVDTGAIVMCIPQHVALQLRLEEIEKREVTTADGSKHLVSYVGPVQVGFEKRNSFGGALVLGDTVLLGAVALEDMDLVVNPARQKLTVNPDSPNIPSMIVK